MAEIVEVTDREPNPDLVAMCERLLRDAKAGDLRSAVVICGWGGDRVSSGWQLDERSSARKLIGEMTICQVDFLAGLAMREGDGVLARVLRGEE